MQGERPPGETVYLGASADADSHFVGWSGACSGTQDACQVTITGDASATAEFALNPRLLLKIRGAGAIRITDTGERRNGNVPARLLATICDPYKARPSCTAEDRIPVRWLARQMLGRSWLHGQARCGRCDGDRNLRRPQAAPLR